MSVKQNIYFLCLPKKCAYVFEGVCPGKPTLYVCMYVFDLFSLLLPSVAPNFRPEPKQNRKNCSLCRVKLCV